MFAISLNANDFSTPPCTRHTVPVPAHAMHFRKPRRSTPSVLRFSVMKFPIECLSFRGTLARCASDALHVSKQETREKYSRTDRFFFREESRIETAASEKEGVRPMRCCGDGGECANVNGLVAAPR